MIQSIAFDHVTRYGEIHAAAFSDHIIGVST